MFAPQSLNPSSLFSSVGAHFSAPPPFPDAATSPIFCSSTFAELLYSLWVIAAYALRIFLNLHSRSYRAPTRRPVVSALTLNTFSASYPGGVPTLGGCQGVRKPSAGARCVGRVPHGRGADERSTQRGGGPSSRTRVMVRGLGLGVRVLDLGCEVCDRVCAKGLGLRTTPNKG